MIQTHQSSSVYYTTPQDEGRNRLVSRLVSRPGLLISYQCHCYILLEHFLSSLEKLKQWNDTRLQKMKALLGTSETTEDVLRSLMTQDTL